MPKGAGEHSFCRGMLRDVMAEVRQRYTPEQVKDAWVWDAGFSRKQFEFHGPNGHYDYNLDADCKWGALAAGWERLLERGEQCRDK